VKRRLLVILALARAAAIAQPPQADQLLAHGKQVLFEQGARPALPELQKALSLYRQAGNRRGEAIATGYVGYSYRVLGEYTKAVGLLEQALAMKRSVGDRQEQGRTLVNLGLTHYDQGDYREAIRDSTEALEIARATGDRQIEGAALNSLGLCHDELGEFQRSLDDYKRALAVHRASGFVRGETDALGDLGGRCALLGQYREALSYYQQALAIDEKLTLKPSISLDLGNIGLCYGALGRNTESLASFDRALALARETGQKKEESDWHKGKGGTLLHSGHYDAALAEYRMAAQVYEQAKLRPQLVEALQDLGDLHGLLGDMASAEAEFRRAQEIAQAIGNPRGVTLSLIALGQIERTRKRYNRAAALFQEAMASARRSDSRELLADASIQLARTDPFLGRMDDGIRAAREALALARGNGLRPLEADALYALGEAERSANRLGPALQHLTEGQRIAGSLGDPDRNWRFSYAVGQVLESINRSQGALRAYERAAATIESVRSQLREDRFRAGYLEDKYQVYISLVRLLLKTGRIAQAFEYSERLRAQTYASLLGSAVPRGQSEAERELRERIRQLQRSIEEENAKTPPERRAGKVDSYSAELVKAERLYQNMLDDLRATDPEYAAARSLSTVAPSVLQARLPADAALIEYVTTPESLIVFVMTHTYLQATAVLLRDPDLEGKVELVRDLINREGSDEWRKPATSLRRLLIDPVEQAGWLKGITRLYVVPHGALHYLPFAAIPGSAGRFLVEDYTISYLPAAAALAHSGTVSQEGGLLAAAPGIAKLRYAEEEARGLRELFPDRTDLWLGTNASETSFKRRAGQYRILHLATHGTFNRLNPLLSSLALQPDGDNDGNLEVHEILDLRLRAQLVTLSACETALGAGYFQAVPAGEEFVGLTRAFLFAGSPAVLATLWQVNDRSTLDLMRSFYQGLEGRGAPAALAEAQRGMIHSCGRYAHPYHWAPFVLVGTSK
jgi:CHAT domain-containing protein/tetratricopeptide (TPR) repeat protein